MTAKIGDRVSDAAEGWSGTIVPGGLTIDGNGALVGLRVLSDQGFGAGQVLTVDMRASALDETAPGEFARRFSGV